MRTNNWNLAMTVDVAQVFSWLAIVASWSHSASSSAYSAKVNYAWGRITWSIGNSWYTCANKTSLKGTRLRHVTHFKNFGGQIHILEMAEMAEARVIKFCTQGDWKLYQLLLKGWQITPKKGCGYRLTWPIFVCATGDKKFRHITPLIQVNNSVDGGRWTVTRT